MKSRTDNLHLIINSFVNRPHLPFRIALGAALIAVEYSLLNRTYPAADVCVVAITYRETTC